MYLVAADTVMPSSNAGVSVFPHLSKTERLPDGARGLNEARGACCNRNSHKMQELAGFYNTQQHQLSLLEL